MSTSNGDYTLSKRCKIDSWVNNTKMKCSEVINELYASKGFTIRYTRDNIAIITIPTFNDFRIPFNFYSVLKDIENCSGFIIDIRDNRGGNSNNANAIAQAFFDGDFIIGKAKHPVYIGAYKAWGTGMDFLTADLSDSWHRKVHDICTNNYFEEEIMVSSYNGCPLLLKQPAVILANSETGSTAENFLMAFDISKRAIIVGEASAGSSGNPIVFDLPGGGSARICTRKFTYPDDTEFINIGIKPHIYASLTIDNIRNAYDSVLDTGLQVLRNSISS